jgi:predicted Fe-S protein YdhL (DUF1289 family)
MTELCSGCFESIAEDARWALAMRSTVIVVIAGSREAEATVGRFRRCGLTQAATQEP